MPKKPRPYFGADPHRTSYKFAERLDCTNFKEFFDSQLNAPVRLSESYAVFWGLSENGQKAAKAVKFFTPGTFNDDRANKTNGNVTSIALVCVDVDDAADARQILNNLPVVYEALGGLNFAVYTTASHTEESPRCRVVVDADGFHPDHYKKAVSWVAGRLGLLSVSSESKVPSQAMYRPTVFSDTKVEDEHPVVAHQTSMGPLTLEKFADAEVLASQPRKGSSAQLNSMLDGLEYLEPKLESVTLDDVRDALTAVDPDTDMMTWVKIGMGMRHQFTDQDEEAFEIFNEWSAGGEKYDTEESTRYRWDHFAANTSDRVPVTIRTMLLIAKSSGWDNEAIQQRYYNDLIAYIEGIQTFSGLVERSLDRIAASPLLTPTMQEALLNTVVTIAKDTFGQKLSIASLKKSLRKKHAVLRQAEIEQAQKDKPLPKWAMNLAFIGTTKQIVRLATGEKYDRDAFDSMYSRELLPTKEWLEQQGEADNPRARNTPMMRPQDYVMNELQIPVAYDETYDPKQADDSIIKQSGVIYVNTYNKSHPTASENQEAIDEAGEILMGHFEVLIKEPEYRTVLLDFMAHNVQYPGQNIRWAPLIQGGEGCGKGLLAQVMRTVMGSEHVKSVDPEKIFSPYNDWAYGSALVVLNEIHSKGKSRYEIENKLKEPIADDIVSINQKFRDHRQIQNRSNYILFTNFHDALAISDSSRRYFVLKSPLQDKEDIIKLVNAGHFEKIFGMLKEHPRALRGWFEQYQISPEFDPEKAPPVTEYIKSMQHATKPEAEIVLEEIIEDGDYPLIQNDLVCVMPAVNALNNNHGCNTTGKYVSSILENSGYVKYQSRVVDQHGTRQTIWIKRKNEELMSLRPKAMRELLTDRVNNHSVEDFADETFTEEDMDSLG